jgi:hypothetical protein
MNRENTRPGQMQLHFYYCDLNEFTGGLLSLSLSLLQTPWIDPLSPEQSEQYTPVPYIVPEPLHKAAVYWIKVAL